VRWALRLGLTFRDCVDCALCLKYHTSCPPGPLIHNGPLVSLGLPTVVIPVRDRQSGAGDARMHMHRFKSYCNTPLITRTTVGGGCMYCTARSSKNTHTPTVKHSPPTQRNTKQTCPIRHWKLKILPRFLLYFNQQIVSIFTHECISGSAASVLRCSDWLSKALIMRRSPPDPCVIPRSTERLELVPAP
jgi:hypothetical protein